MPGTQPAPIAIERRLKAGKIDKGMADKGMVIVTANKTRGRNMGELIGTI